MARQSKVAVGFGARVVEVVTALHGAGLVFDADLTKKRKLCEKLDQEGASGGRGVTGCQGGADKESRVDNTADRPQADGTAARLRTRGETRQ